MPQSLSLPSSVSEELPPAVGSSDGAVGCVGAAACEGDSAVGEVSLPPVLDGSTDDDDMGVDIEGMDMDESAEPGTCDLNAFDEDPDYVDIVAEGGDLLNLSIDEGSTSSVPTPAVARLLSSVQDFAEFYSPPRVLPAARSVGLSGALSLDIVNGWNFDLAPVRDASFTVLPLITFLMLSPPCTIFSCLQALWNFKKMSHDVLAARWSQGMAHLEHSMACARAQTLGGRFFCFEHPAGASSWQQSCVKEIESMPGVFKITIDQCMLGLRSKVAGIPMRKRTSLLTNSRFVVAAFSGCRCDCSHEHQVIQGAEGGVRRSVWAQRYPDGFIRKLVQCALEHKRHGHY